jgi:hypothetical protein
MKLYSYSSESLNFVEVKWIIVKFAILGIIIGIVILFCVIEPNQSVVRALGYYSTNTLAAENNFLRDQISFITARVSRLEMKATQLNERADNLDRVLHRDKIACDTVTKFTNVSKLLKSKPLLYAAKSSRP